jgi:hypothetical protein
MQDLRFNQADAEKLVKLLNIVAENAVFKELKVADIIQVFGLLSFAQKTLLEKIKANIMEVVEVKELKPEVKSKGKGKS